MGLVWAFACSLIHRDQIAEQWTMLYIITQPWVIMWTFHVVTCTIENAQYIIWCQHSGRSHYTWQFGGLCSQVAHAHKQITCATMATRNIPPFRCQPRVTQCKTTAMSHMPWYDRKCKENMKQLMWIISASIRAMRWGWGGGWGDQSKVTWLHCSHARRGLIMYH